MFGVSHVAVVKWEGGKTHIAATTDVCIRLYIIDHLKTKDKDFREFYHEINPEVLSKSKKIRTEPIVIEDFEDLKSA